MDKDIFKFILKGVVRPQLEYASSVWAPHFIYHIEALENVQRRSTKQVPGLSNLPYEERLKALKIPTVTYRRLRGDMIQTYKLLHPTIGYDKTLPHFLKLSETTKVKGLRGTSKKLYKPSHNDTIKKHEFSQRIITNWNSLPENIVSAKDVWDFEKRLDAHWADQPIMYDTYKGDIVHRNREIR